MEKGKRDTDIYRHLKTDIDTETEMYTVSLRKRVAPRQNSDLTKGDGKGVFKRGKEKGEERLDSGRRSRKEGTGGEEKEGWTEGRKSQGMGREGKKAVGCLVA